MKKKRSRRKETTLSVEKQSVPSTKPRKGYRTVLIKTLKEVETIEHGLVEWVYSRTIADTICNAILEGMTVKEITDLPNSPPRHVIYAWLNKYEDFNEKYYAAKKARADYYHDRVIEEANKTEEENSRGQRVKIDALKWAAKVGSPEYTENPKDGGGLQVNIQVNTGITREED